MILKEEYQMFERRYHIGHFFGLAILFAIAAAIVVLYAPRSAQNADLLLKGSVPASTTLTVTAQGTPAALTLTDPTTVTALTVADVFEKSNWPAGYTVTLASANLVAGGRCAGGATTPCLWSDLADAGEVVALTVLKGASALTFNAGTGSVTWSDISTKNKTGTHNDAKISYVVNTLLTADDYEDTLTFTIATK